METEKIIERLSNQLGTTSEYLWGVLISQASIYAITTIIEVVVSILLSIFCYKLHKMFSKEDNGGCTVYCNNVELVVPMIVFSGVCAILLVSSLFCISPIITALANPEYWALEQILNKF